MATGGKDTVDREQTLSTTQQGRGRGGIERSGQGPGRADLLCTPCWVLSA